MALPLRMNLLLLATAAYAAHARLAPSAPTTAHLTGFYLVVATGGALGGLLNGLVAPMFFDRVLEYPLPILELLMRRARRRSRGRSGCRGTSRP